MEQKVANDEIEIDLKELFAVLLGRIWIIIMTGLGIALLTFLLNKFIIVPQYDSTTKIYILNKQDSSSAITYSDLQSGTQLTKDYMTLVTSRPVVEQVIAELGLTMEYGTLAKMITVSNPQDTRILNITVKYKDPFLAKEMADSIREAAAAHITNVMNIEQVNVVEEANIPETPSSPHVFRNTAIGGMAGILLASFLIFLVYILNDTIKTPDDIEKYLGISVLSSIPVQESMKQGKKKKNQKKKVNHTEKINIPDNTNNSEKKEIKYRKL